MATLPAPRAATEPDYAEDILGDVRSEIEVQQWVLDEARHRRDLVRRAMKSFAGFLHAFGSGSLAHATAIQPFQDADLGLVLDLRHPAWRHLGPDGAGPGEVMHLVGEHVLAALKREYPHARYDADKKRAVLFEFGEPIDGVDPRVEIVICLTRDRGYWIPNTEIPEGWDASDPETHTELMTAEPKSLRVFRARLIRLAKAAVNGDGDQRVLIPWNISALALELVEHSSTKYAPELADFLRRASYSIASGPTPGSRGRR